MALIKIINLKWQIKFVLYCIVLYCIVLYCVVLYCIVLCCIGWNGILLWRFIHLGMDNDKRFKLFLNVKLLWEAFDHFCDFVHCDCGVVRWPGADVLE